MTRPNILLITTDQMRADCIGSLGNPNVVTPNLDSLASRGVAFTHAYASTPSCVPARASIFTGMSPRSHGRVGYRDRIPWTYEHTLPGELAAAGYHTQCVGKMHTFPTRKLMGFHNIVLHDGYLHHNRRKAIAAEESWNETDDYLPWLRERAGYSRDLIDLGLDCNASLAARTWDLPDSLHPTSWVVTESINFLRRRDPERPFFLWMSFVRPHPPFDPPRAFLDMYRDVALPAPPVGEWVDTASVETYGFDPTMRRGIVPRGQLDFARKAYYALISHIDNQIGRFMNAMDEYGVLDDTVILFTSDHGEMLGDHLFYRKALPYEGSARVPFILSLPRHRRAAGTHPAAARGQRDDRVVELRDVMPTLLDSAGISIPDTVEGSSVAGPRPVGKTGSREYIHGEHAYDELSSQYLTDGKMKYIWFSQSGVEQLFDLRTDPHECTNLVDSDEHADTLSAWRERLIRELSGREEGYTDGTRLIAGRSPQTVIGSLRSGTNEHE